MREPPGLVITVDTDSQSRLILEWLMQDLLYDAELASEMSEGEEDDEFSRLAREASEALQRLHPLYARRTTVSGR